MRPFEEHPQKHITHSSHTEQVISHLWDKVTEKFATRQDVSKIIAVLKRMEMDQNTRAIQSGNGGPIFNPGRDGVNRINYESWVETNSPDEGSKVYNYSSNALSAAAAAEIIKTLRQEMTKYNCFKIVVCGVIDSNGYPVVQDVDYNCIYLTQNNDCDDPDSEWVKWIAVKVLGRPLPYKWERIGTKKLDLRWVKNDLRSLNTALDKTNKELAKFAKHIQEIVLNKAIKPLKDLRTYINSPEFIQYVFEQLPRAAMGTDGLMSANSFALLSMLALWASNDHKVMGGGALGYDSIIELMDHYGVPTEDLRETYKKMHGNMLCECPAHIFN